MERPRVPRVDLEVCEVICDLRESNAHRPGSSVGKLAFDPPQQIRQLDRSDGRIGSLIT